MKETELLEKFEKKYKFLYEYLVNGVPVYTCLRDDVLFCLQGSHLQETTERKRGRVYPKRILDGIIKLRRMRDAKTLIFTSSVYRRDHGRNLAAEYLLERYPDAVVFEWPARNESFDSAYFKDPNRERYCPIDGYVVWSKIIRILHRSGLKNKVEKLRDELRRKFAAADPPENESEQSALDCVIKKLPESFVMTEFNQNMFRKMFRKYRRIEFAIDFWGSGRENIFPVLKGNPEKIELQHGLINSFHPGYIYPSFISDYNFAFFKRKLLVYGEKTKHLLADKSIFDEDKIEVTGNPRIIEYKKMFPIKESQCNLILFASQTFEIDGTGTNYYSTVIPILKSIQTFISCDPSWEQYKLGVKLHPRETNEILQRYKSEIPDIEVFDNTSQLFDLLSRTYLQLTVSSTTLFEAAEFDTPTIMICYRGIKDIDMFGFEVKKIHEENEVKKVLIDVRQNYDKYLNYIKQQANKNI